MIQVALTVGPQGAGKSTFCENFIAEYPSVVLVSRDKVLIELFGSAYLDEGGGHFIGKLRMWEIVIEHLKSGCTKLILDCWNESCSDRQGITSRLRSLGVEIVEGWHFITPPDVCMNWFLGEFSLKNSRNEERSKLIRKMDELAYQRCFNNYNSEPVELEQGFDLIHQINSLAPPPLQSLLQTINKVSPEI